MKRVPQRSEDLFERQLRYFLMVFGISTRRDQIFTPKLESNRFVGAADSEGNRLEIRRCIAGLASQEGDRAYFSSLLMHCALARGHNLNIILEEGGLPVLISALEDPSRKIKKNVLQTLCQLASSFDMARQESLFGAISVDVFCALQKNKDPAIQSLVATLLETLVGRDSKGVEESTCVGLRSLPADGVSRRPFEVASVFLPEPVFAAGEAKPERPDRSERLAPIPENTSRCCVIC